MRIHLRDPLTRAWLLLLGLSLCTTAIAITRDRLPAALAGALLLGFAWAKMRIIMRGYLGLAAVPAIARGFDVALGAAAVLIYALFLIPEL
ncbi:hypothetical protein LNKW23_36020 [Paralimibaculum aggregatum]|uniref:Nitric oxide reductase F protein n=1 Tax=Paralimibaculum aggregatum TaxID=3036245 RepID=A0ABQ6LPE2_9RHOB|nr:nitric oxide reductase F protein [Limibaculum sp. NKW23]GMG84386.1 hypothetical protein LNKW23_36020 [Limibaculum sp. NKW23]